MKRFLIYQSFHEGEEDPGSSNGSKNGILKVRLQRLDEKKEYKQCNDAENTTLDPKWGQWQKKVDIAELGSGWKRLTVATLGPQGHI